MKRLLLLWICLISLCLAFSACADDPDANTPPSTEPFVPTVGSTAHVHQFGQWITVTEATCTEAGEKTRRCACGDVETQSIEIIPHIEVTDAAVAATCQTTGLTEGSHCSVCDTVLVAQTVTEMLPHTVAIDAAVAATCQATGLTEGSHCSVCDTVLVAQAVTEMLPHTVATDAAVAATCQATGLTEGSHCAACDTVLVAQAVTEMLPHTVATDAAVAATCQATGLTEGSHCAACNTVLVAQTVVEMLPHTVAIDAAVAATCQAAGLTEGSHCSVCDTVLVAQTVTEMLPHTVATDAAVAATCQATGLTEGSHCSACDTVLVAQTVTEMLPHTVAIDAAVAATCQATGLTEGSHCSVCDTVLVAQTVTEMLPHTVAIDAAVAATCQATGLTEGSHCSACNTVLVAQTVTKILPHTKVIDAAVAATCQTTGLTEGSHCSACNTVLVAQTVTKKLPHTEVADGAIAVTCTKWGYSGTVRCSQCKITISSNTYLAPKGHNYQNSTCTHCGKQEIDYSNITLYASREGAALFSAMPNGAAMQKLYDEMEQTLNAFHSSPTQNATYFITNAEAGDLYTVARFDFGKHGVTLEEAQTVYAVFRKDHPIFYWMSYYLYWQGNQLIICTVPDFAKAADRTRYNQMIYEGIAEYHALADGETNSYNIALIYFNAIIENYSYAYDANGNALTEQWAHSIIGGWLYDQFVCEGYAKLFQLLLTLSDIENYFVVGNARGSHVWNLVKMDDGNWYWFDLTWADTSNMPYHYFCVTDATLFVSHAPSASNQYGLYPNATLPERATSAFADDDFPLAGQRFTVGGSTYELVSPGKVILVAGKGAEGDKFVYKGVVYHIVTQS